MNSENQNPFSSVNNILVTGANGFIGKALCAALRKSGCNVIEMDSSDGDIADDRYFSRVGSAPVDHVYHLAAKSYVPDSWKQPSSFYRTNVTGTLQTLEFCKKRSAGMTYLSAYLYGIPETLPIAEDAPVRPNNPYAHSKQLAEQLCDFYRKVFHMKIIVVRPFNVFGDGQNETFLIPKIISQALHSDAIRVMDLLPRRDYIYIDDLVRALLLVRSSAPDSSVFNIGSGYSLSVDEVIDCIQTSLGCKKKIVSEAQPRENEIPDVIADIRRAGKELGWSPAITFKQGIDLMVKQIHKAT